MTYTSSAKDIMFTFAGPLSYYLECDGNIVFLGKAQGQSGSINITRRIRDYLETGMPDFRDFDGVIVPHPKQLRTFNLREASGMLLETYTVLLESSGEWTIFGPTTEPINGHTDPRQKIFWTTVESAENSYESNTEGAEYSGETESGETEYYFNYVTPRTQNLPSTSSSLTVEWDTNYESIKWYLFNGDTSELIESGETSGSSVTIFFPENTSLTSTDYYVFEAYNDAEPSTLGSIGWTVSASEEPPQSGTSEYYFSPEITTAYTGGRDVTWYFNTNYRVNVSAEDGVTFRTARQSADFYVSIKDIGSDYIVLKVEHLPDYRTGYTAECIAYDYSNNVVGKIKIINTATYEDWERDIDTGITEAGYLSITINKTLPEYSGTTVLGINNWSSSSTISISYSVNGFGWNDVTVPRMTWNEDHTYGESGCYDVRGIKEGDTIYFKSSTYRGSPSGSSGIGGLFFDFTNLIPFSFDYDFTIKGNIMSLIYGDDFEGKKTFPNDTNDFVFAGLFYTYGTLRISGLRLPATALTDHCYYGLFQSLGASSGGTILPDRRTRLIGSVELPATQLAIGCYQHMFSGADFSGPVPELPATTIPYMAYFGMFQSTEIIESPILPATAITDNAYAQMFRGCKNLKKITCYAKALSGNSSWEGKVGWDWVEGVSDTGNFYRARGSIWYRGTEGIPDGWNAFDVDV